MYIGYSDFNIPKIYVVSFNKDMLSKYKSEDENWIYNTVLDYKWILDEMIALATLVSVDTTGDGKTQDDIFGTKEPASFIKSHKNSANKSLSKFMKTLSLKGQN